MSLKASRSWTRLVLLLLMEENVAVPRCRKTHPSDGSPASTSANSSRGSVAFSVSRRSLQTCAADTHPRPHVALTTALTSNPSSPLLPKINSRLLSPAADLFRLPRAMPEARCDGRGIRSVPDAVRRAEAFGKGEISASCAISPPNLANLQMYVSHTRNQATAAGGDFGELARTKNRHVFHLIKI